MNDLKDIRDEIDDYEQTIQAILGIITIFTHDKSNSPREGVKAFQGIRFTPSLEKSKNTDYLTPDIAILFPKRTGILAEVKKSFPSQKQYWLKSFKQLMSYDDDLVGWPTIDERVNNHDLILIVHQSRFAAVKDYYENLKDKEIQFERLFSIIEFNKSDERKPYYFFRKSFGNLSGGKSYQNLHDGIQVPMHVIAKKQSEIKFYDAEPPLPYVMYIIWENVVLQKASDSPSFEKLRKNQKLEVELEVDNIVDQLHRGFSFSRLSDGESVRQPKIPKKAWIVEACKKFVELNEAKWGKDKTSITFFFRQYDEVIDHFVNCCIDEEGEGLQKKLFEEETEQE